MGVAAGPRPGWAPPGRVRRHGAVGDPEGKAYGVPMERIRRPGEPEERCGRSRMGDRRRVGPAFELSR